MRRIVWTDEAVRNLDNIAAYLNELNPSAANRLAASLLTPQTVLPTTRNGAEASARDVAS